MSTYSFLSVKAVLTGPGGVISLGDGAGAAEEGITVGRNEDANIQKTGADGTPMNTLNASKAGRAIVRLLKTSPVNQQLAALHNLQAADPALWGQNVFVVTDKFRGDVCAGRQVAFKKLPDVTYAKEAGMNEWEFDCGILDMDLGSGF